MSIQQAFNQGLMGTTFLLGQVPAFKRAQERSELIQDIARDEKALDIIEKRMKNTPEGSIDQKINDIAIDNFEKQVDAKIHDTSITSKDPRIRANTILLDAKRQYNEQAKATKEEQAKQAAVGDLEKRTVNQQNIRDAVAQVRPFLSNTQYKKLEYKAKKEERRQQNGTDE